jgi:type II secretory pathway pseudopilin PulG
MIGLRHPLATVIGHRQCRYPCEAGMTLVELLVAMALTFILFTVVAISIDTFLTVGSQVQASYVNSDQILPLTTNFQRLLRTEVEPGPPSASAVPTPMFKTGVQTAYAATFYANVGSTAGPAQIVASLSGTYFTVTQQLPTAGSCPTSVADHTDVCAYPSNGRIVTVISVPYVQNLATHTPIFTYTLLDPDFTPPQSTVSDTPTSGTIATKFANCTATVAGTRVSTTCPGDTVEGVEVDLQVKAKDSVQTVQDTVVYRLSATSQTFDPSVG